MGNALPTLYFIAWLVCAVGTTAVLFRASVAFRRRWFHRIALFNVIVIGGLLVALTFHDTTERRNWIFVVPVVALIAIAVTRARVCPTCGSITQPQNFWSTPQFCRRCGARLDGSDGGAGR